MEKINEFSIEPYIDGGGILGTQLILDHEAVNQVMSGTALQQGVFVARGEAETPSYNIQGSDELEASKSNAVFKESRLSGATSTSELRELPAGWEIVILDQELHREVDGWMEKNYKTERHGVGSDVYKERFVKRLNHDARQNVTKASGIEKNRRLGYTLAAAGINDVSVLVGMGMTYLGGRWLMESFKTYFDFEPHTVDLLGVVKFSFGGGLLSGGLRYSVIQAARIGGWSHETDYNLWEMIVPNLQARARVKGWNSLRKNGDKLIRIDGKQ